jgi:hypothetical protein
MFRLGFMAGLAYVTSPIPRLVSLEVVEALRSALRQRSAVTVVRIIAVVHMTVESVIVVKPGACTNEHPASKPIWPVIAVRSAIIRGVVEVSVRAHGRRPHVYADGNLGWRHWYRT